MKQVRKLAHVYNKLEEYALVLTLAVSVVIITLQVIMRFGFNNSLSWSEEAAKYLFVWLIWLGTSISARDHISLELITGRFHGKGRILMDILVKLIWGGMCVFLLFNGLEVVESMIGRGKTASAMPWLKVWVVYLAVPISQGVLALRIVVQIFENVKKLFRPNHEEEPPQASVEGGQ